MSESKEYILVSKKNGVTTLTMNNPKKLNGWTMGMMDAFKAALAEAAVDDETKVVVFTGTGKYYSAGVNLGGTIKLMHPKALHKLIIQHNQSLFDTFLDFPKPILAAVNGPAIGAAVTTATLCDAIIAAEEASFLTPFARLGVPPEGCSSVHFERLMGKESAERMLGKEGWKPTGAEAKEIGLVQHLVTSEKLMEEAQRIAEEWIVQGKERTLQAGGQLDEYKDVNAHESRVLADAFLASPFLKGQFQFLWSKKKRVPATMFLALWLTRPAWSLLLR